MSYDPESKLYIDYNTKTEMYELLNHKNELVATTHSKKFAENLVRVVTNEYVYIDTLTAICDELKNIEKGIDLNFIVSLVKNCIDNVKGK